jgi:hypothetical protein
VKLAAITAAVIGLTAARVKLGIFEPDEDEPFFKTLHSRAFVDIDVAGVLATANFDGPHSFAVGQKVTVVCAAALAQGVVDAISYTGVRTITAKTETSISWALVGNAAAATFAFAQGDLIFTTPMVVISAAENKSFNAAALQNETTVEVLFYFGLQAVDQDFIAIESLAYALRDAIEAQENWAGNCAGPDEVTIAAPQLLRKDAPIAALYVLGLKFNGI